MATIAHGHRPLTVEEYMEIEDLIDARDDAKREVRDALLEGRKHRGESLAQLRAESEQADAELWFYLRERVDWSTGTYRG